jgi:hypothetical protein
LIESCFHGPTKSIKPIIALGRVGPKFLAGKFLRVALHFVDSFVWRARRDGLLNVEQYTLVLLIKLKIVKLKLFISEQAVLLARNQVGLCPADVLGLLEKMGAREDG